MSQPTQAVFNQSAVRQQLEKILAHPLFARSERMGRFLRLAVERTLEGKPDELKEYLVGIEVFDRKPTYDPRVDPIVRVEARRLRSKLKAYYDGDGRSDPLRIEFQTGTYAPRFAPSTSAAGPAAIVPAPVARTTAVLPFVNLSPNPDNEYFSDGLTEELIHALTKLPGLRVVAWNTATRMRDRQQDIIGIGRQLKVATVLTGSVRMGGSSLRVRAQLVDTATGVYLWSENYDRQVQDIFAIQEEIARAIVRTLRVQLEGAGEAPLVARGRTSLSAYDWYLKGRYLLHRRTPENLRRGKECFERAIGADAESALAHTGLADAYSLMVDYGQLHPAEGMPRAKAAAERAIALDPELAEAHASLAFIRAFDWDWEGTYRGYLRAIELNPGYATAHFWLATDYYAMRGRFEEALAEIDVALQLDPLSGLIMESRAYVYMLMRRYEEAISVAREILSFDPTFYKGYTSMARAYGLLGCYSEALQLLKKGRELAGEVPSILGAMGHVYALAGDKVRARELLAEIEQLSQVRYVPSTCFAIIHLGLGEYDRALDWLEKGCAAREAPMVALNVHPIYDPLRGESRFQALIKLMRLV